MTMTTTKAKAKTESEFPPPIYDLSEKPIHRITPGTVDHYPKPALKGKPIMTKWGIILDGTAANDDPKLHQANHNENLFVDPASEYINGNRAVRSQADNLGDYYSYVTSTDIDHENNPTRQEFAAEADINNIMDRFGATAQRQMTWGAEVDYTLDLQSALHALDAAKAANFEVPEELKTKYPRWQDVLNGAESGQYANDLMALAQRKQAALDEQKAAENAANEKGDKTNPSVT